MEFKGFFRTCLNTKGIPLAEITFEGSLNIIVEKHGAERTADEALITGDALVHIETDDTVLLVDRVGWTVLATFRDAALPAYNGHPDHRMRIEDHHPDPAFFGIIDPFATNTASQFTHFASGTALRNDSQMHEEPP
jgi:hypothetical protein